MEEETDSYKEFIRVITEFIKSCEVHISVMKPEMIPTMETEGYVLVKTLSSNAVGSYKNVDGAKVVGRPNLEQIKNIMTFVPTGKIKFTWYSLGGNTQQIGGQIKNSTSFDWYNAAPDVNEDAQKITVIGADDKNAMMSQNPQASHSEIAFFNAAANAMVNVLKHAGDAAKRESEGRANEVNRLALEAQRREESADKRVERLETALMDTVDKFMGFAKDTLALAVTVRQEGFMMQQQAHSMTTNAMLAERRAKLSEAKAEAMLQEAEQAIEEGKLEGWSKLLALTIESPQGGAIIGGLADRLFGLLDKFLLKNNSRSGSIGLNAMIEPIMEELKLTDEQKLKAVEIMQKHMNQENK